MAPFEKILRFFADITALLMGSVEFSTHKNTAPLWLVIAMAAAGVIALVLLGLVVYTYFTYML